MTADRGYEYYEPAYRYGWESAAHHRGKSWSEVEPELERGWETFRGADFKGESRLQSTWDDVKAAVRDAWDRVAGGSDRAARREMAESMNPDVGTRPGTR